MERTARSRDAAAALHAVIEELESYLAEKNYVAVGSFIEAHVLEVWYGQRPERLAAILREVHESGTPIPPIAGALAVMVDLGGESRYQHGDVQEVLSRSGSLESMVMLVGRALRLRTDGHAKDAHELLGRLSAHTQVLQPVMDERGGWRLFGVLQRAISAMLAGDLHAALALVTQAQLQVSVETLPFLTRDAYVKYALIHACFGDRENARGAMETAAKIPRTDSWVEAVIDASGSIVEAILESNDEQAIASILAIPMHFLGEMWPFYAYALQLVFERSGQRLKATRQLEMLDMTALPRHDREGFSGSVIPGCLAANALMNGNLVRARELLARVDQGVPTSMIVEMMLGVFSGRPAEALRLGTQLQPLVTGLRQLELWRFGVLASAYLALGDRPAALETVRSAVALSGALTLDEAGVFSPEVREQAVGAVAGWPATAGELVMPTESAAPAKEGLTKREIEVITLVARGMSRDQIAAELFLSANTVKAHNRSLYRKLGVKSRNAAIIEAERRGVL